MLLYCHFGVILDRINIEGGVSHGEDGQVVDGLSTCRLVHGTRTDAARTVAYRDGWMAIDRALLIAATFLVH